VVIHDLPIIYCVVVTQDGGTPRQSKSEERLEFKDQ
jgi:hypothetical protein